MAKTTDSALSMEDTDAVNEQVLNLFHSVSTPEDAPYDIEGVAGAYTVGRAPYLSGLEPVERTQLPGYNSTIVTIMLALFVLVVSNFKHYSVFIKSVTQDLLTVRRRTNIFNDNTINESRLMFSLIMVVCFSEAVLLFSRIYTHSPGLSVLPLMLGLLGATVMYYMVQLVAYSVVGNVFTSRGNSEQWVRGFNASQSLLGIALVLPALVTLFYPGLTGGMFTIGIICYISARILFICKGFKIFYQNFFSLIYFILYLCTLEIAPILLFYRGAVLISYL